MTAKTLDGAKIRDAMFWGVERRGGDPFVGRDTAGIGGSAGELYSWRRAFSGSILTDRRAGK
jgi:hypothetical protein